MHSPLPLTRDLVLAGGGHAHVLLLRRWGMRPLPGVRLTLVNPEPIAAYTGMLPAYFAGHISRDEMEIDLLRLARFAGARWIEAEVTGISQSDTTVTLNTGRVLRYDRLSLNIGATVAPLPITGFAEHVTPARPLTAIAERWAEFLSSQRPGIPPRVAIVGAGAGGCELALAIAHRLKTQGHARAEVSLVERARALPGMTPATRRRVFAALARAHVSLRERSEVTGVDAAGLSLSDGEYIPASLMIATTGASPQSWLAGSGLTLKDGFVAVDDQLRSLSNPAIYAAGDCAYLSHSPRPKAGVYAVRAAPVLAHNLAADLSGSARKRFRPQRAFLHLIALGPKRAVAQRFGLSLEGHWVWRWKERIDRRFMDRLDADLRPMLPPPLPRRIAAGVREIASGQPPCAGCGAKIGPAVLRDVLDRLPVRPRVDVEAARGDDAALLGRPPHQLVISTDHLRAFTGDEALLARIAAHHALGDLYAMGAAPQAALINVILPPMSAALHADTLASVMQAADQVFAGAGASIAGGHTTHGAELCIGFTVTGTQDTPAIGISAAHPGDALLLTKPIGGGTILAAEMALRARGRDLAAALRMMQHDQGAAVGPLRAAHAMTDVTGFGLAGHLAGICRASDTGARLLLDRVPLMQGALDLAQAGIRSTLFAENRAAVPEISVEAAAELSGREALLFDPQTSGGLLASVPFERAEAITAELKAVGYPSAIIGEMTDTPGRIEVTDSVSRLT